MTHVLPLPRRRLGTSDLTVSLIACGGGVFGASCQGADLDALLDLYRAAGGNFIDTAHCYAFWTPAGAGCSERAIGDYLRRHGPGDLIVATKGGHPPSHGYRPAERWLSPEQITADLEDSLERLGLDTIDLYWLHRDDTRMPVGEVIEMLNAEIRRGRIRHLGASNWHRDRIAAANAYAAAHGLRGFIASQPEWNLAQKNGLPDADPGPGTGAEMRVLTAADRAWHRATGLPVVPYAATANGYFASGGQRAAPAYDNPVSRARLERVRQAAARLHATPGQVALAWLLHQDVPVFPIVGSLDPAHLAENLAAATLRLTPTEVAWLETGTPESAG